MKYSFLVPVYNAAKTMEKCLHSILNQTYKDYEIVLYNDGSVDNSRMICDKFLERYPDIIRVKHGLKNQGIFRTRIELIALARGEITIFVDADDEIRPNLLEEVEKKFEAEKCDAVIYDFKVEYDFKFGVKKFRRIENWQNDKIFKDDNKSELYRMLVTGGLNAVWRKAFKKSLFDSSIDYNKYGNVVTAEDLLLSLSILTSAKRVVYLHQPLYLYKCNHSSITHVFNKAKFESELVVYKELGKYVMLWNLPMEKENISKLVLASCEAFIKTMASRTCGYSVSDRRKTYYWMIQNEYCIEAYNAGTQHSALIDDLFDKQYDKVEHVIRLARIKEYTKMVVSRVIMK